MKYIVLALLMIWGCGSEDPNSIGKLSPTHIESNQLTPNNEYHGAPPCPPPLIFTIVRNGKDVRVKYTYPCYPGTASTSKATDGTDYGTGEVSTLNEIPSNLGSNFVIVNPIVDPTPIPNNL